MKKRPLFFFSLFLLIWMLVASCHPTTKEESETKSGTPVSICNIGKEALTDYIELNAVSSYLKKNSIKASISGIIEDAELNIGDKVEKGQVLYAIKTKEANALTVKSMASDTNFNVKGIIKIVSPKTGVISSMAHQKGDYVLDGDELAVVAEQSSLVFLMQLPFEMKNFVKAGQSCQVMLPDNVIIDARIQSNLPIMDMASQTQNLVVKLASNSGIPENLVAMIRIPKSVKAQSQTLPKECVLTNETQTEFWVMKLINDSTAVKIPIKKGIASSNKVEILAPEFNAKDNILLTGNYGLEDTAKVILIKK